MNVINRVLSRRYICNRLMFFSLLLSIAGINALIAGKVYAQTELLLSRNAAVSASSQLQAAALAVDGNTATRWESTYAIDPATLTLDLGNSYNLSRAVIRWEAANAANYTVQGSNNNASWTTLATRTGGTFGERTDTLTLSGNYRYVRMNGTARSAGNTWGYSIWEMEVYGLTSDGDGVPLPWRNNDIGSPRQGNANLEGNVFTTAASGVDIWGTSDSFHYVYQPIAGDVTITARVTSVDPVNPWTKVGVMIRDGLGADAKNAFVGITVANGATFQRRTVAAGTTVSTRQSAIVPPYWVRLERRGNSIIGSISINGNSWMELGSETITTSNQVYVGLAHTSHDPATIGLATIDQVSVKETKGNLPAFCGRYPQTDGWQSSKVWYSNGRLTYSTDANNRIPDYSYAGYRYGEKALPNVPVVTTLSPTSGDQTARIQAALDAIGGRAPDANGHRGTLQLQPGRYEIYGTLRVRQSGVVLRGSGRGTNAAVDTILYARGNNPHQRTVVILGTNDSSPWDAGASTNVTDSFVAAGALSVNVQNAGLFSIGQEVIITHPSTQAWINAIGGGGVTTGSWAAGSKDIPYIRKITAINGSLITFDAPVYNHLNRSLSQARVALVSGRNLIREAGVENLRVDIETAGGEDENHAWSAIAVTGAEDSWVKRVSTRYFGYAGVKTEGAIRVTIDTASATSPIGIRTGGRFYNFDVDDYSQLVLFTNCVAADGRHNFISNGTMSASGVVWHRCTSTGNNDSEGHRYWSTGMLFDAIGGSDLNLKLFNRGNFGTQHGWSLAHSTAWNSQATFFIQKPPTAQNYGISGLGNNSTDYSFPGAMGYVDIRPGQRLVPESLYEAQMCDRLTR
jgi:regulation of enolase protein 1 (concanavalin A-like superfamily)